MLLYGVFRLTQFQFSHLISESCQAAADFVHRARTATYSTSHHCIVEHLILPSGIVAIHLSVHQLHFFLREAALAYFKIILYFAFLGASSDRELLIKSSLLVLLLEIINFLYILTLHLLVECLVTAWLVNGVRGPRRIIRTVSRPMLPMLNSGIACLSTRYLGQLFHILWFLIASFPLLYFWGLIGKDVFWMETIS